MSLFAPSPPLRQSVLIYDAEICNAVPDGETARGVRYCKGWGDFAGMGVSVVCAYSYLDGRYHVFMRDNLQKFEDLLALHAHVVGFNSLRFDDKLLAAHGVEVRTTYDLCREIQGAARKIPWDSGQGRRSYTLAVMVEANLSSGKSGHGADAPLLFQRQRYGELIDYCLKDVQATKELFDLRDCLTCPHTGTMLALPALGL